MPRKWNFILQPSFPKKESKANFTAGFRQVLNWQPRISEKTFSHSSVCHGSAHLFHAAPRPDKDMQPWEGAIISRDLATVPIRTAASQGFAPAFVCNQETLFLRALLIAQEGGCGSSGSQLFW